MPLRYLFDEDSRDRSFLKAIDAHNTLNPEFEIDAIRVGDSDGPPSGTLDPDLVRWAIKAERVIVSKDKNTLITHHSEIVNSGLSTPGLFIIRPSASIEETVEYLGLVAHLEDPIRWQNAHNYIPCE